MFAERFQQRVFEGGEPIASGLQRSRENVLPTELRSHFVPNCRCRDLGALAGDLPNC